MNFYKYESCGNDFIIIEKDIKTFVDIKKFIKKICDRNYGIGADGIMLVSNEEIFIYNKDGSRANMCGNGLKCLIKYFYDKNIIYKKLLNYNYEIIGSKSINSLLMKINFKKPKKIIYNLMDFYNDQDILYYKILYGVWHVILFKDFNLEEAKYLMEKENSNINYVKVINNEKLEVTTYEKGVGLTKSCGTGSISSFYICYLLNYCNNNVIVEYENDFVELEIDKNNNVIMTGSANYVFKGEI